MDNLGLGLHSLSSGPKTSPRHLPPQVWCLLPVRPPPSQVSTLIHSLVSSLQCAVIAGPPPSSLIRSFLTGSVPCAPPPPPARLPPPSFDPSSPAPCPGAAGLLCERDAGSYLTAVNPHFGSHTATVGATRVPTLLPPDSTGATLVPTVSRLWISSSSSRLPFPFFSCLGQRRKLTTARLRRSCGSWRFDQWNGGQRDR